MFHASVGLKQQQLTQATKQQFSGLTASKAGVNVAGLTPLLADTVQFAGKKAANPYKAAVNADYLLKWFISTNSMPQKAIKDTTFVVLDIETMGLDRNDKNQKIIEISALKYKDGKELEKFTTFVQPDGKLEDKITEITGITQEMAESGIPQKEALEKLAEFAGEDSTIVAHNTTFDLPYIRTKLRQEGLDELSERFKMEKALCTMTLARKLVPNLENFKAVTVGKHFGVVNEDAHRAEADTRACALTFFKMIDEIQTKQKDVAMENTSDLLKYQGPCVPIWETPVDATSEGLFKRVISELKPFA